MPNPANPIPAVQSFGGTLNQLQPNQRLNTNTWKLPPPPNIYNFFSEVLGGYLCSFETLRETAVKVIVYLKFKLTKVLLKRK